MQIKCFCVALIAILLTGSNASLAMEPQAKKGRQEMKWRVKKQVLTAHEQKELWDMYIDFLKKHNSFNAQSFIGFTTWESVGGENWDYQLIGKQVAQLDIELPFAQIKQQFKEKGIIQLRSTTNATKLLIGCGNSPIISALEIEVLGNPEAVKAARNYKFHMHKDYVTLNPELFMNPTVVSFFGLDNLDGILPRNHFDELATESTVSLLYNLILIYTLKNTMKQAFEVHEIDRDFLVISGGKERFNDSLIQRPEGSSALKVAVMHLTNFEKEEEVPLWQGFSIDNDLVGFAQVVAKQPLGSFFTFVPDKKLQEFVKAIHYFKINGVNKFIDAYDIGNDGLFVERKVVTQQ